MAATFILHLFILIQSLQIHYSDSQSLQSLQTLFTTFNARGTSNYCPSSTSSSVAINLPTFIPNSSLTLICYNNIITQLHITGNNKNNFDHENLSTESFFNTISTIFPGLKVLSLVSLSLNGPLPASVLANSVFSLEILNVSSNCFHGDIPFELSYLKNLHTLVLDHNNFSGPVPDWIGYKLSSLTVLSFRNNSLDGYLPFSLARLVSLRVLDLSRNQLSGDVPVDFKNLTNLQVLDLESNQLGPSFPVLHNRLLVLVLRGNRFGNGIQGFDLRSFYQLRKLDLSSNEFNGPFPDFVFSLPSISYLNFSGNKFTGKLSANVSCSNDLVSVDLSFNRFTGELPTCMQELENNRRESVLYGWNCLSNVDRKQQHNVSFCHNEALAVMIKPPVSGNDSSKSSKEKVVVASSVVGGVVVGGVAVFGVVLIAIRSEYFGGGCAATPQIRVLVEKISPAYTLKMLTDARYISETMKLGGVGILYRTYVLGELIEATNNFHKSTFMGNGSHGQLYKGQLNDGSIVAIRNLNLRKKCSIQSCTRQIELISKLRHPNLVNPIGHCFDRHPDDSAIIPRVFLVFEFVPNGTLRASLTVGQKFSWAQRLSAAIGISKGIQFLNTRITTKIFPYNLKITDVLLDQSFQVKISGYNLPLLAENKVSAGHSFTKSSETLGRRFETEEDDNDHDHVYDLGVIMLELILGRAIDCPNDITVAKDMLHVSLVADEVARRSILDPLIRKECCDESLKTLMELCVRCLSKDRPSIDDVLWNLEFIAQTDHTSSTDDLTNNHIFKDDTVVCITERIERY